MVENLLAPTSAERVEKQVASRPESASSPVNMSDPEIRKSFPAQTGNNDSVVSNSGQLIVPYLPQLSGDWQGDGGILSQELNILQSEVSILQLLSNMAQATGEPTSGTSGMENTGAAQSDVTTQANSNQTPATTGSDGVAPNSRSAIDQDLLRTLQSISQELQQDVRIDTEIDQLLQNLLSSSRDGSTSTTGSTTPTGSNSQSNGSGTTTGTTSGAPSSSPNGNGGSTTTAPPSSSVLASMEQADPTLSTTLNAASKSMTQSGFASLENYLATNNPNANPNADAMLMSSALSQANLSSADATALQKTEIADMPAAQVLTYAKRTDPSLYKTINDASSVLSAAGNAQMQNYLINNYTGDNAMDSTLMSNILKQSGLSSADQAQLTGVLQSDLPSALTSDPFAQGLQSSDPALSKTLTDAASNMSGAGYQSLETYVEDNYTGQPTSDGAIMSSALTHAGLNSSDVTALTGVLQQDLPSSLTDSTSTSTSGTSKTGGSTPAYDPSTDAALQNLSNTGDSQLKQTLLNAWTDVHAGKLSASAYNKFEAAAIPLTTPANDPGGIPFSTDTTLEQAALGNIKSNLSSADVSTLQSLITAGQTTDIGSNGTTTSGENGNGNPSSTTTFTTGGNTLLQPPSTSSGLVTPHGSLSGDKTAYQGTIQGSITGDTNITADSMTTGQGNGTKALAMGSESLITSMDLQNGKGFQQKYGYFEADIKVEGGANGWPGWFLESSAHALNNNANSSEIDIMEAQTSSTIANGQTSYNAGVHRNSGVVGGPNKNPSDSDAGPFVQNLPNITNSFNTYGVNWQPNDPNIEFYFDGKEVGYNKVYDTTDASPMYMVLDNGKGGWSTSQPNAQPESDQVAWVRAYQLAPDVNSANDPNGTEGATITDTNPNDSPPVLSANNNGVATPWVNTFNSDFTQASAYTTNSGYTSSPVLNSQNISEMHGEGSGPIPASTPNADNTPWYQPQWLVDQQNTIQGVDPGISTKVT